VPEILARFAFPVLLPLLKGREKDVHSYTLRLDTTNLGR